VKLKPGDKAPSFELHGEKNNDEKYSLGFPLLSDQCHEIADKYGEWQALSR